MTIRNSLRYIRLYFKLKVMEIKLIRLDIHRLKTINSMYSIILEMMNHKAVNYQLVMEHGDLVKEFYQSFHKLESIGTFLSKTKNPHMGNLDD